jgi:hypothetical protein
MVRDEAVANRSYAATELEKLSSAEAAAKLTGAKA